MVQILKTDGIYYGFGATPNNMSNLWNIKNMNKTLHCYVT